MCVCVYVFTYIHTDKAYGNHVLQVTNVLVLCLQSIGAVPPIQLHATAIWTYSNEFLRSHPGWCNQIVEIAGAASEKKAGLYAI